MQAQIEAIKDKIAEQSEIIGRLLTEIDKVIVGQRYMVERIIIGLLADGHILIEGVPGLAKTLTVRTLAETLSAQFQRIQFTPDLLPADLIGTMIYSQKTGEFTPKQGPVFTNLLLADEINRAPAKVQSALLEAMQERQVTIGSTTFFLPKPFLVLATQNPIEQEGTYPLPEAQIDRFMLKLSVTYPNKKEELEILNRMSVKKDFGVQKAMALEDVLNLRDLVEQIYVDDKVKQYIVDIVFASRYPETYGIDELKGMIEYGASPRASIYLTVAARAHAFLRGRPYVTPEDVKAIGSDVLRHRVIISYEAEAEDYTSDTVVQKIFDHVEVP